MDIQLLTRFFMGCTLVNGSVLIVSFLLCALAGDWIYRIHRRWFHISREAFDVVLYSALSLYKILILVFNVAPWVALSLTGWEGPP